MLEEVVTYISMIAIGMPPVVLAVVRGERFEAAPAVCLMMIVLGFVGLTRVARRRVKLPRARARSRSHVRRTRSFGQASRSERCGPY